MRKSTLIFKDNNSINQKLTPSDSQNNRIIGTPDYIAPEII